MANITAYPTGTVKADDLILGTSVPMANTADVAVTQNFTASSIAALGVGYQSYTALLTQSGTNAPVAIVLANTTGRTFVWTRSSTGNYALTASGSTLDKTKIVVFLNNGSSSAIDPNVYWSVQNATQIIDVRASADGVFTDAGFEIRIY